MKLSGIFAAIPTPFDHNGDIYRVKIEHNLSRWNAYGLAGYVVGSWVGEGPLLAHDEKLAVWELSAKSAAPGRTLIADVGVEGVREAADLAAAAARLGYHAVCAGGPRWYSGSQTLFFRALADRSPIPVIVIDQDAGAVAQLSQHPNIAGAVVNTGAIGEIAVRAGFQLLAGSAGCLWDALRNGAQGAVLGFAAASPYAAIAVWEAFRTREEEAGLDWQNRISQAAELVYGVPGLKYAMDLNGYYGGPPRLPLVPVSMEARAEIAQAFEGFSGKT
jgi:4-hydroxy-2-oxoglutarate aldolase